MKLRSSVTAGVCLQLLACSDGLGEQKSAIHHTLSLRAAAEFGYNSFCDSNQITVTR